MISLRQAPDHVGSPGTSGPGEVVVPPDASRFAHANSLVSARPGKSDKPGAPFPT